MGMQFVIAGGLLCVIFILFLVISRSLNNTINHLTKLEYLLRKELELHTETLAIKRMMAEESAAESVQPQTREPSRK